MSSPSLLLATIVTFLYRRSTVAIGIRPVLGPRVRRWPLSRELLLVSYGDITVVLARFSPRPPTPCHGGIHARV